MNINLDFGFLIIKNKSKKLDGIAWPKAIKESHVVDCRALRILLKLL